MYHTLSTLRLVRPSQFTFTRFMVLLRLMGGFCSVSRVFSTATPSSSFSPAEFRRFPITQVTTLNHDTKVLRMALESPTASTGMEVSSLVMVQGENEDVFRPYTPITLKEDRGYFDLLVKKYARGSVSSYIHDLKVGQEVCLLSR